MQDRRDRPSVSLQAWRWMVVAPSPFVATTQRAHLLAQTFASLLSRFVSVPPLMHVRADRASGRRTLLILRTGPNTPQAFPGRLVGDGWQRAGRWG